MNSHLLKNKTFIRVLTLLTFSYVFFFVDVSSSYACSCIPPGSVTEELEKSAAVFRGKVLQKEVQNQNDSTPVAVQLEVKESWKGTNQANVVVYTALHSAACGYEFEVNKEYIIYAYEQNGKWHVTLCSRTAPVESAAEDIKKLNEYMSKNDPTGKDIADQRPLDQKESDSPLWLFAGLTTLAGAAFFFTMRLKQ